MEAAETEIVRVVEPAPKPGHRTTEFWLTVAAQVAAYAAAAAGVLPGKWAAIASAVGQVAYCAQRLFAKRPIAVRQ